MRDNYSVPPKATVEQEKADLRAHVRSLRLEVDQLSSLLQESRNESDWLEKRIEALERELKGAYSALRTMQWIYQETITRTEHDT